MMNVHTGSATVGGIGFNSIVRLSLCLTDSQSDNCFIHCHSFKDQSGRTDHPYFVLQQRFGVVLSDKMEDHWDVPVQTSFVGLQPSFAFAFFSLRPIV